MIYESYYWKKELIKLADKLEKRTKSKRWWTEAQHGAFEKEIMIGFYVIRKLIEANKLTYALVSRNLSGTKYPNNGKNVTLQNNHRFHEFYDFEKAKVVKFNLIFLCNQIVHTYIFSPYFNSDDVGDRPTTLRSILFCSDDNRNKWLFELSIEAIITLFRELGNDYPNSYSRIYDVNKKDFKVINSNRSNELPKDLEELIQAHEKKTKHS